MTDPTSDLIVMHLWKSLIFQELRNQCETCDWSQKHFPWPASQPGFSSTAALQLASSSLRTQAGPPNTVKPGICFLMAVRPAKQWICSSSRCYSGDDSFFFFLTCHCHCVTTANANTGLCLSAPRISLSVKQWVRKQGMEEVQTLPGSFSFLLYYLHISF